MKYFIGCLTGAFLGASFSSWLGPKVIAWYFEPPVEMGVSCKDATIWAMERFRTTQLWGTSVGLILGLIFALLLAKKAGKPITQSKK